MSELVNNFPEFIFMGSVLMFYFITAVFIVTLFISEVTENGWVALVSFTIFALATKFFGNFQITDYITFKLIGIYLLIGLVHSLIRTFFYGRKREFNKKRLLQLYGNNDKWKLTNYDDITKSDLKGNVFRWWFLFPVSLLTWIFSDLMRDLWNFLYKQFKKAFEYILDLGLKSIK
jgi:hypothetical protein|tara:strand:+ start:22630 stop:23154 length:525 start_codon:yes stop_codon:yes gene_type:complete